MSHFAAVPLLCKQQQDFLCNILPQDTGKNNPEIQETMPTPATRTALSLPDQVPPADIVVICLAFPHQLQNFLCVGQSVDNGYFHGQVTDL